MKPQDHTPGEQIANPIDHAAIGRRANFHREELRFAAFNLARTVGLAQHLVTEIEADEDSALANTGTLYAVLETVRMAQMHLHGTLRYVVEGDQ